MTVAVPSEKEVGESAPLRMSWEAFLDWLDEDTHADWVEGEVIMHSPVSARHQEKGGFLLSILREFVSINNSGRVLYDPFQMKIGPGFPSRAPDILFVARENLERLKPNYLEGPADLIVEIVSPESRGRDRGDKFYEYESGGVREYLLLDPERQRMEWNRLGDDGVYAPVLPDATGAIHSTVLPGFFLRPEWLWQETLPTVTQILREWQLS